MAITLEIFWLNSEQIALREAGIENDDGYGPHTREVTFYRIDYIYPDEDGYCIVFSGGSEMVAKKKYDEVKEMLAYSTFLAAN